MYCKFASASYMVVASLVTMFLECWDGQELKHILF